MSTSEYDEYGFPLENFTELPVVKPRVRCCSHCRSPNHTRNQCTAYRYSEAYDENSSLYREWNYPNPVAARYIREKKEYKRSHPSVKVCNHTPNDLYIYQNIYYDDLKKQFVIPGNTTKTFTKEIVKEKYLPFQYYLVWGDRGDNLTMNDLQREDVENFISLKYGGGNYEIDAYGNSYIDPWKTAALKSRYLLEQLVRLGAKNNENYEPILDLVEDIEFPEVSESDKEDAGIPSVFTNYT